MAEEKWTVDSWKTKPASQQPHYPEGSEPILNDVLQRLHSLPPLVHVSEIRNLRGYLKDVFEGKKFILQGGDCAERFLDCQPKNIENKLKILLQMSLIVTYEAKIPTVRIGRIAGQYGKPRSSPFEKNAEGKEIPSFRGDSINDFSPENRNHDPQRLLSAYWNSAGTLNYIRALVANGFAGLRNSKHWDLGYINDDASRAEYEKIVTKILDCLNFIELAGLTQHSVLDTVDFFTSHEALILNQEAALTHEIDGKYYNTGAHFLWIGNRTRELVNGHVEYVRGIENPIGIKVGPGMPGEEVVALVKIIDPSNTPGKVVLISRFGCEKVAKELPPVVEAVKKAGLNVIWICDPMHGNTHSSSTGFKTREFNDILKEISETFKVHKSVGSRLNGVHFELTGENVTECTGGPQDLSEKDLHIRYTTYCDPRLNYAQSMEMAFLLCKLIKENS